MYRKAKLQEELQGTAAEAVLRFDWLVAVAHATADQDKSPFERHSFSRRIQLPPQYLQGIGLDAHVQAKFAVHSVLFRAAIAIDAIVRAAAVEVHAVAGEEPGIDFLLAAQNGFCGDLVDSHVANVLILSDKYKTKTEQF